MQLNRDDVQAALAGFERRAADPDVMTRHAAVCLVVVRGEGEQALVITRRAPTLRAHSGQWALPGGRVDDGETAVEAALRELEEVGLAVGPDRVLGELDDYLTRSGYCITPVVVWAVDLPWSPRPEEAEVASIHLIPMTAVDVDPVFVTIPESDRPVIRVPLFERFVHAPTGAVLHQFREVVLHGRATRVADYEQPVFAWK